jgi:uncharacterized protein
MRIEVGYGLHAIITDALSGRIIRETATPLFKAGNYAGGINASVDRLIAQMDRTPADAKAIAEAAAAAERAGARSGQRSGSGGSFLFWVVVLIIMMSLFGRGSRRGRRYRGGGSNLPVIIWGASQILGGMGGRGGGGGFGGGGGGGFGGFGGGMSGGGGASGGW